MTMDIGTNTDTKKAFEERACPICGSVFLPSHQCQKYCRDWCRGVGYARSRAKASAKWEARKAKGEGAMHKK